MNKKRYPRLEINLDKLEYNVRYVVDKCKKQGVSVCGVIKGVTGLSECDKAFDRGGVAAIGTSRLEQIEEAKDAGIKKPYMLIRIPMLSEVEDVVSLTDISLNSEMSVLKALNRAAKKAGKIHKVVLMYDIGDLREGFWKEEDLVSAAVMVEKDLDNLTLLGVGTNVGCYGSVLATKDKLEELVNASEKIEKKIGRKLEMISGGATSSLMRVFDGDLPKRINALRIGEGIILARDLDVFYGYDMSAMHQNIFTLQAEVIEVRNKPTFPQGEIAVDAFGKTPNYEDLGIRKRALVAIGKVDYGSYEEIFPRDSNIKIIGASSDHTILDVEDCNESVEVGDIIEFDIDYASLVYLTSCRNVRIAYVENIDK